MKHQQWVEILNLAMQAEVGVLVRSNDSARARAKFHRIRDRLSDPFMGILQFRVVDRNCLMIFKPQGEK